MQFTELSELNKVVGMMRIASCNSPTFHDRQDSEVDRIFNSSPKMEMQLRNSWIDKMASFKPMSTSNGSSTTAVKKTTSTGATNGAANGPKGANGAAADTMRASSKKPVLDENDTRAGNKAENGKDAANGGADAKQRRTLTATGKAAKGTRQSQLVDRCP